MRWQILFLIDWAVIAVSFFNTIAMIWLGLTVLLNTQRRRWGAWAAGGGLLLGGLFFAGHSAVVGRELGTFPREMDFWWRIGWIPFVGAPYLWYLVVAWYSRVLGTKLHRIWLGIVTLLGLTALALLVVANPLPTYGEMLARNPNAILSIGGIPAAVLVYPAYSVLCVVLSLSALRRPARPDRFMGDLARQRARPWLIATSLLLLLISLAVGIAVAAILYGLRTRVFDVTSLRALVLFIAFDLFISGLVAITVVLVGRAVASYEIFTGKALPSGGLFRQWRRSLLLAAGYGTLIGWSLSGLAPAFDPIYILMLATLLMTVFFALLSWRSFVERERNIAHLRPFVANQQLYERIVRPTALPDLDPTAPFHALCADVLGTQLAYLVTLGPLTELVGPGLAYPRRAQLPSPLPTELARRFTSPQTDCFPLDPRQYAGAVWAVPLWSERGLIGVLLLGEKRDRGLYTQEEIDIARTAGERLLDTQASAEIARRLMDLQRQRLSESQVLDRRTRRVLHDDVLPRIHTAILQLVESGAQRDNAEQLQTTIHHLQTQLTDVHRQIADLLHDMPATAASEVTRLGLIGALRQAVELELSNAFDKVTWRASSEAEQSARSIATLNAEVLFYAAREAVRNAARYGRHADSSRPLRLDVAVDCRASMLEIAIEDDGVGLGSTARGADGSGHGLALHSTMMAVIGGTLTVESAAGRFTRVTLALPWEAAEATGR